MNLKSVKSAESIFVKFVLKNGKRKKINALINAAMASGSCKKSETKKLSQSSKSQ